MDHPLLTALDIVSRLSPRRLCLTYLCNVARGSVFRSSVVMPLIYVVGAENTQHYRMGTLFVNDSSCVWSMHQCGQVSQNQLFII